MQDVQTNRAGGAFDRSSASRAVAWPLARKVSVALVAIMLCTMLLTAFFGYYKFESVFSNLVQSRYSFIVFTIKRKIEDSLNLGLPLRQLRQTQEVVEREKVRDAQILAIEVFDSRGEMLFSTDRGGIGAPVPAGWLTAATDHANSGQAFGLAEDDSLIVGMSLVNNLGKVEGGVVLRYPSTYLEREARGLIIELSLVGLGVFLLFSLLAGGGLYLLLDGLTNQLQRLERGLDAVVRGDEVPPPSVHDGFETHFREFLAKASEASSHMRDATQEVERLDRLS